MPIVLRHQPLAKVVRGPSLAVLTTHIAPTFTGGEVGRRLVTGNVDPHRTGLAAARQHYRTD
jgi:hypothetical protein